jgi:cystathionine beta-lyase/cystathionine gamma-synthase
MGGGRQRTGYYTAAIRSITEELAERSGVREPDRRRLHGQADRLSAALRAGTLSSAELFDRYEELVRAKAAALNAVAEVARSYPDMAAFWADAKAQEAGRSDGTFWDSYEHGARRAFEQRLAAAYGSEECVLVNSGMAALDAVIGGAAVPPGAAVATHAYSYFETSHYLKQVIEPRGITVRRYDLRSPEEVAHLLADGPRLLVVEPVLNTCGTDVPSALLAAGHRIGPGTAVCVDNSLTSHGLKWPVWREIFPHAGLTVVESVTKYLSSRCAAGVAYGESAPHGVGRVRAYARAVGSNLQERAFNQLVRGELDHCAVRVGLHADNADRFVRELDTAGWESVEVAGTPALPAGPDHCGPPDRPGVPGRTGVLFCVPRAPLADHQAFTTIPGRWRLAARAEALDVDVRAGFGWARTSCRTYGADPLNQSDGRPFLRISIGLETPAETGVLARTLNAAVAAAEKEALG